MTVTNFQSAVLVARQLTASPPGFAATSTTSLLLGTGSKSFTTQPGTAYVVGSYVRLVSAANSANYMEGTVTGYSGSAMTVGISFVGPTASGTFADWSIVAAGSPGTGNLLSTNNLNDIANPATARDNLSVVHTVTAGAGITVTGTVRDPIVNITKVSGPNLLYNTNWQLFSGFIGSLTATTAASATGTGLQNSVAISSFSSVNQQPTFFTSNTQELHNGSLVTFGTGQGGLSGYALRVINLTPNVSFGCQLPFGNTSLTSSAITAFPCGIYDPGGSGNAADPWTKFGLAMWPDDFAANACPGAKRVLGLRKISNALESFTFTVLPEQLATYRGRNITFGALVRQKVGAGGVVLNISDNATSTSSTPFTGSSFVDANNNNYQFQSVTARVSLTASSLTINVLVPGAIGDIIYLGIPTMKFGTFMTVNDLGQNPHELIVANSHWNPPCTVPFTKSFPATQIGTGGTGLYGWSGIDIEAIGLGQAHNSLSKMNCKIECQSPTVGLQFFVGAMAGDVVPSVPLTFGPQTHIQVANNIMATSMTWCPLRVGPSSFGSPPGTFAFFTGNPGGAVTQVTFDFDDVMA
jgi:hypothetical protein